MLLRLIGVSRRAATVLLLAFPTAAASQAPADTLDVFFVGNSYIYFNNLPGLLEGIAAGLDGPPIRSGSHTIGGSTLRRHLDDGQLPDVLGPRGGAAWDRVVLQEQSALGTPMADQATGRLGSPDAFHSALRELAPLIRGLGAEPLLYMTWAKERFPAQVEALAEAYEAGGAELGVDVAPVGRAWSRAAETALGLGLHLSDGSHPTPAGSYLAACVIYTTLTGLSPIGAPREILGQPWDVTGPVASASQTVLVSLSRDEAAALQRIAWETVNDDG